MITYFILIAGFILLIKGADFFVDGSVSVARKFKVPGIIIGLTIVAMGTSAPECAVSISAALKGNNAIAISNVIGSNIFNLLMVCGICALLKPLPVNTPTLKREFPMSIGVGFLLLIMCYDTIFNKSAQNTLARIDGIILLILFIIFLIWMVRVALKSRATASDESYKDASDEKILSPLLCIIYVIGGLIAIVVGGDIVVDSASAIAGRFGLSDTLIGLTIVAMGTSLPELVTSFVAAKKGQTDMAVGNVIGSNIFNILLVLGISAVISPIGVTIESIYDMIILAVVSLLSYVMAVKNNDINKLEGIIMIGVYAGYTAYIIVR